jgi:hypothetical protein
MSLPALGSSVQGGSTKIPTALITDHGGKLSTGRGPTGSGSGTPSIAARNHAGTNLPDTGPVPTTGTTHPSANITHGHLRHHGSAAVGGGSHGARQITPRHGDWYPGQRLPAIPTPTAHATEPAPPIGPDPAARTRRVIVGYGYRGLPVYRTEPVPTPKATTVPQVLQPDPRGKQGLEVSDPGGASPLPAAPAAVRDAVAAHALDLGVFPDMPTNAPPGPGMLSEPEQALAWYEYEAGLQPTPTPTPVAAPAPASPAYHQFYGR